MALGKLLMVLIPPNCGIKHNSILRQSSFWYRIEECLHWLSFHLFISQALPPSLFQSDFRSVKTNIERASDFFILYQETNPHLSIRVVDSFSNPVWRNQQPPLAYFLTAWLPL